MAHTTIGWTIPIYQVSCSSLADCLTLIGAFALAPGMDSQSLRLNPNESNLE